MMDYAAIRQAEFVLIDKDIYDKLIPVEWEELDEFLSKKKVMGPRTEKETTENR